MKGFQFIYQPALFACWPYVGCDHFVYALGPSALEYGKVIKDFRISSIRFLSHLNRVREQYLVSKEDVGPLSCPYN